MSRQVTARVIGQRRRILLELPQAKFRQSPIAVGRADEIGTGLAPVRQPIEQRLVKRLDAQVPDSKERTQSDFEIILLAFAPAVELAQKSERQRLARGRYDIEAGRDILLEGCDIRHWRVTNCE